MFDTMFWVKYVFRVIHIVTLVLTSHEIIANKMGIATDYKKLAMISGIAVMISGFVNTFLLQPKRMGDKRKPWVGYHHLKLLTAAIFFTPLHKILPFSEQSKIDIRFWWLMLILITSPFFRFYREHFTAIQDRKELKKIQISL